MDLDDAYDRIDELQSSLSRDDLRTALAAEAEALSPGEVGRAAFLNVLAEFEMRDGDLVAARATYTRALEDGGPTILHPLAGLLDVTVQTDDHEGRASALERLMALARADELTLPTYDHVGSILEEAGELRQALRWFNMPLRDVDPDEADDSLISLLNGHYRVRRALGLPIDRFDEVSAVVRADFSQRQGMDW